MKIFKKIKQFIMFAIIFFFLSTIATALVYNFLPVPLTPFMIIQYLKNPKAGFHKEWVPLSKISNELSLAVIASEDQLFLEHFGFDINAIKKAMEHNERTNNKHIKGASTISQQTAKNVFLWPERSWLRKGLEIYFTALIETLWTKERILEVYLNVIEMGKGIYGAQAASVAYFKRDAYKLNTTQSALIAAVLPNPEKLSVQNPSLYVLERQQWIMEQMQHLRTGDYLRLFQNEPESKE